MKKSYIESVVHEVYCAEMEKVKREMLKEDCAEEFANALQVVYITKVGGSGVTSSPTRTSTIPMDRAHVAAKRSNWYQLGQEAATSAGQAEVRYMHQSQGN